MTLPFVDFVEQVLGVELTPAQRVLALVGFDGVPPSRLDGSDRELAGKLFGPIESVPPEARMVLSVVKGARIGGSYVFGALYSLWRALTADLSSLAPGEVAVALIVAPDLRLARQVLRYAIGAAESVPSIARFIASQSSDGFVLLRPDDRKVSVEVLPATRGGSAVRGRSLVSAVLSEAAFFRDESAAVNDLDLFRAVMPRVMPGGLTVLESTPWAETGLLYDLFSANFSAPQTALVAHAPTLLMRPDARTRMIVENEFARDEENARREFGAEFLLGATGLFFGSELRAALRPDLIIAPHRPRESRLGVGGDIGLSQDESAFVVSALGETGVLTALDSLALRPAPNAPLKLSEVVRSGCRLARQWGERRILVDHHELHAAREHLPPGFRLVPCPPSSDAKVDRFVRLREAFRQEKVIIPGALAKLIVQLSLVVAKPRPGGGMTIKMPRRNGSHQDLAAAFVLSSAAALHSRRGPALGQTVIVNTSDRF